MFALPAGKATAGRPTKTTKKTGQKNRTDEEPVPGCSTEAWPRNKGRKGKPILTVSKKLGIKKMIKDKKYR